MKIRLVGAELLDAEKQTGQTDVANLILPFRNFANAPKTPFQKRSPDLITLK